MKVRNVTWTVKKIQQMLPKINPKPQYQRGEVWKLASKQLLIDSILCHFDIPKIYLHDMRGVGHYDYDVTDGQQRLRAIWDFLQDGFRLSDKSYESNAKWRGSLFSELVARHRNQIRRFKLVVAIISDSSNDEVRELFSRLQRGSRLTPPELRNSIPSQLGDVIRSMGDNHAFFTDPDCPFKAERFHHHDLCALAFAIELFQGKRDLKAPDLREMYTSFSGNVPQAAANKVGKVLTFMHEMQKTQPKSIRTKWGFIDLYWFISERFPDLPKSSGLARKYAQFELRRHQHTAKPEVLLTGKSQKVPARDRRLYDYIVAFKTSGGTAKNVRRRHRVFLEEFA